MNRMWNAVSPVQFNLDYSPGRKLLFESKYDIRTTAYSNPDKVDLSDAPEVRSMFQKAIGEQNLDKQLAELAKRPSVKKSLAKMEKDLANGDHKIDPITYPHNELIGALFDKAKKRAWAKIARDPKVAKLIAAQKLTLLTLTQVVVIMREQTLNSSNQKTFSTCLLNNYASEL